MRIGPKEVQWTMKSYFRGLSYTPGIISMNKLGKYTRHLVYVTYGTWSLPGICDRCARLKCRPDEVRYDGLPELVQRDVVGGCSRRVCVHFCFVFADSYFGGRGRWVPQRWRAKLNMEMEPRFSGSVALLLYHSYSSIMDSGS